jgi:hypothetical protein
MTGSLSAKPPVTRLLTVLLWGMLGCAVAPTVCLSGLYFLVMAMFGKDSPNTTMTTYLSVMSIPLLVGGCALGLAALSLKLWEMAKWRVLSFPIALALDAAAVALAMRVMPGIAHWAQP